MNEHQRVLYDLAISKKRAELERDGLRLAYLNDINTKK